MEYLFKSEYYQNDLTWHDFQMTHSKEYGIAMILCLLEYTIRNFLLDFFYKVGRVDVRLLGFFP